jgi:HK97 family phage prohead protease
MRKVTKLFVSKAQSIDEKNMTATFKISDAQTDRMGEIVDQKSWNFNNYMLNPILLWGHDPSQPENVLGSTTELSYDEKEDATFATVKFDRDINTKADLIFNQVARGTLRTVSVGMIVHSEDSEKDQTILKDCELLEISIVPIPANPRAIALAFTEGSISKKDALFMKESMEKELTLLQSELSNDKKRVVMNKVAKVKQAIAKKAAAGDLSDDDTKFLTDLLSAINDVDTHIDAADMGIDAVLVSLSDFLGVTNPDEDAADDSDSADGADDEGDDATPPAKSTTIPKKKSKANGGTDGDQSGADEDDKGDGEDDADDEDEITDDTELTEDQQKEFDEAYEKSLAELQVTK